MSREQRVQDLLVITGGEVATETVNFVGITYTNAIRIEQLQSIFDLDFVMTTVADGYAIFQDIGGA